MKFLLTLSFCALVLYTAFANASDKHDIQPSLTASAHSSVAGALSLDVFKSPTCGCCQKWIDHIELSGFKATAHDTDRLNQIKTERGILPQYQSCHTAISKNGFVFEGHIPAAIVKQFLDNPPKDAIGLAVPGMPMGSPGMEMGNMRDDYNVLLLKNDGSSDIYEQIIRPR